MRCSQISPSQIGSPVPFMALSYVKTESQLPFQLLTPTSSAVTVTCGAWRVEQKHLEAQKEKGSAERHRVEGKESRKRRQQGVR